MKPYVVVLLVAVGILGGFYGGYRIGHNSVSASTTSSNSSQSQRNNAGGGGFGGGGRGFAAACPSPGAPSPAAGSNAVARGSITNLASTSLTITTPQCDVKVVFGNTVQVSKNVAGSTSDLRDTLTVTVIGTRQADGSIKATTIQIGNPNAIGGGGANPAGGGGG